MCQQLVGRLKVGHWEIRLQLDGEVGGQNRDKAAVRYKCGGKWMDRPHLALAQRKQLGNAWTGWANAFRFPR